MHYFADLGFKINSKDKGAIGRLQGYDRWSFVKPAVIVDLVQKNELIREEGVAHIDDETKWYFKDGHIILDLVIEGHYIAKLTTDPDWSKMTIEYSDNRSWFGYTSCELMLSFVLRNRILLENGIVIHSSAINHKGKGIIFTAASGTGKSTHTNLWQTHRGATVINDDTPAIRLNGKSAVVYGTPWSGSSDLFKNESLPLAAVVVLEQAPVNEVVRLNGPEAVKRLMPRCFLPYQDEGLLEKAFVIIEDLMNSVPVLLLKCRPDIEALETVESWLTEHSCI